MKVLSLGKYGKLDAKDLLLGLLRTAPNGQTLGQMEQRLSVMEKIKDAGKTAELEDAEYQVLLSMLETRNDFAVTDEDVFAVYKMVKDAKAPEKKVKN